MTSTLTFGTDLTPAIFGLLGVLLGGIVAAVGNYLLQKRREQIEAQAEQLDAEAAMRVVAIQLDEIDDAGGSVLERGRWSRFADADGWLATWEEERKRIAAAFARAGRAQQLDTVARGFLVAKLFRQATERRNGSAVDGDDREYLLGVQQDVGKARDALRSLLDPSAPGD